MLSLAEVSDMWPLTVTLFTEMCGRGRGRRRRRLSIVNCGRGRGRKICGRGRQNVRVRTSLACSRAHTGVHAGSHYTVSQLCRRNVRNAD